MKNIIIKAITISSLASTIAFGASIPSIGDIQNQIKEPNIKKEQQNIPKIETKEYKSAKSFSTKTIKVVDFSISGNNHIPLSELEKFFVESKNRDLTFNQINQVVENINKYYKDKGYFVSVAYLPVQNVNENNGVVKIEVIEGNYGNFKINNKSLVKYSKIEGILKETKKSKIVSTDSLKRSLLILRDTPGIAISNLNIAKGDKNGSVDFEVTTEATNRVNGYAVVDNVGGRYTGKNRLMGGIDINSPSGIGDKITLFGMVSNGYNLKSGKIGYSAPLTNSGLMAELTYSHTNYSLTEEYEALDAIGTSKAIEAKLSYPVIKSEIENLNIYLALASKNNKDEVKSILDTTKKDITSLKIGLNYDKGYLLFDKFSNSTIDFYLTRGKLSFNDATKEATDVAGDNTNGYYTKLNANLFNTIQFNNQFSFDTTLKMQYALNHKNLDGSEDFFIGGSSGVKLYPDGELSAEKGYLLSMEAKYNLPAIANISNTLGLFYDVGKTFMANSSNNTTFESKLLQDTGLGLYTSYKDFFSQLQVAYKVGPNDVTSEPDRTSRVLFQAGMSF
jgi:hemolysin activation/secretion protein